jgi:hypothetical protein
MLERKQRRYFWPHTSKPTVMNTLLNEDLSRDQIPATVDETKPDKDDNFFPSGGIAFFVALILLCLAIWFGIYFLMIDRV